MRVQRTLAALILIVAGTICRAQSACGVRVYMPNAADTLYEKNDYAEAQKAYAAALTANPNNAYAFRGEVRSMLAQGNLTDALALAASYAKSYPNDAMGEAMLGQVHLRMGDMTEVISHLNRAATLDNCNAWAHFEAYRYLQLAGLYARAKSQLDVAHALWPEQPSIQRAWKDANTPKRTTEEELARVEKRLKETTLSDDRRKELEERQKVLSTVAKGSCTATQEIDHAVIPMVPMSTTQSIDPDSYYGVGLSLKINGTSRSFLLDTGASGITVSRLLAKALGLSSELETRMGGVGSESTANSYVTHVDDIVIGKIELHNCMVTVLNQAERLDVSGLIGADVFKDYVVTLDFPGLKMKLDPLPPRPGETKSESGLTMDDEPDPLQPPHDRYIAPEMQSWTDFYRYGHDLLVPTQIGNAPKKLFILDSGASLNSISPAAARLVTKLSESGDTIHGISGDVANVQSAKEVTLTFANVRQTIESMDTFDTGNMTQHTGVEISGFIGYPALRYLTLSLDYRDNLMHVVYDKKHGH